MFCQRFGYACMGLPGAGKTSLINAIQEIFEIMNRKCVKVNLDFSNQLTDSVYDFDCREYVQTSEVQQELQLGPNGGVLEALEIFVNGDGAKDLISFVQEKQNDDKFFLFDTPGQVECFVSHGALKSLFYALEKGGISLVTIWIGDAIVMQQCAPYLQYEITSLCVRNTLQLPFVQAVNKVDLFPEGLKMTRVVNQLKNEALSGQNNKIHSQITQALIDIVDREGSRRIETSALQSASLVRLILHCDALLGYQRGMNGEYTKMEIQQQQQIEMFIEEAKIQQNNDSDDEGW